MPPSNLSLQIFWLIKQSVNAVLLGPSRIRSPQQWLGGSRDASYGSQGHMHMGPGSQLGSIISKACDLRLNSPAFLLILRYTENEFDQLRFQDSSFM